MNEEIIIRKAKENDFEQLHDLIMQVHKMHVRQRKDIYKDIEPLNFEEFKNNLLDRNNIYLVAEIDKRIVGLCFSEIKEIFNNRIMNDRRILNISNICVDKHEQRKGIGKKLYTQILKIGKGKNVDSI